MRPLRQAVAALWDHLNPSEPSPHFLAIFMIGALAVFALGILIGQL